MFEDYTAIRVYTNLPVFPDDSKLTDNTAVADNASQEWKKEADSHVQEHEPRTLSISRIRTMYVGPPGMVLWEGFVVLSIGRRRDRF